MASSAKTWAGSPDSPVSCRWRAPRGAGSIRITGAVRSVRVRQVRVRQADFRRHQTLGAVAEADEDPFAGLELRDAVAAQSLHMHEDVRRSIPARQEAEPAQAIEPLDGRGLEPA